MTLNTHRRYHAHVKITKLKKFYIVENINNKGIHLVSSKENIHTSTATGKLLLTIIAAIAQFERENLCERQLGGIKIAKSNVVYKGRKPVKIDNFEYHYNRW